jgi:hypothetical protein
MHDRLGMRSEPVTISISSALALSSILSKSLAHLLFELLAFALSRLIRHIHIGHSFAYTVAHPQSLSMSTHPCIIRHLLPSLSFHALVLCLYLAVTQTQAPLGLKLNDLARGLSCAFLIFYLFLVLPFFQPLASSLFLSSRVLS